MEEQPTFANKLEQFEQAVLESRAAREAAKAEFAMLAAKAEARREAMRTGGVQPGETMTGNSLEKLNTVFQASNAVHVEAQRLERIAQAERVAQAPSYYLGGMPLPVGSKLAREVRASIINKDWQG